MPEVTVFGAGAMGTALAIHAARRGLATGLWANPYDERVLQAMRDEGKHPALPEHLPPSLQLFGPDDLERAASDCEVAVMGANSSGARSLAGMVRDAVKPQVVVSLAKGLEPDTGLRMSEVYGQELPGARVVATGGPCLAPELAEGSPTVAVWGAGQEEVARGVGDRFTDRTFQLVYTDDVVGLEYCAVLKNVAAIGLGMVDGLGKLDGQEYKNAKAALFTRAIAEVTQLVTALGGRAETVMGPAGVGDVLVTSLGGRNRLYGELVGEGNEPAQTVERLSARGMTVEGVDSARDLSRLTDRAGVDLPYHQAVCRVLFDGEDPRTVLEVLC
ncbi:MAG: NAD(P)H-dependent glycerol-3-phosphate dehydrogenase [Actinobacteria bacterium]|nr:NAD(P)H-dependent glycerol-3-phosphate dehydrogenase [Actinomycetota bacterium]